MSDEEGDDPSGMMYLEDTDSDVEEDDEEYHDHSEYVCPDHFVIHCVSTRSRAVAWQAGSISIISQATSIFGRLDRIP